MEVPSSTAAERYGRKDEYVGRLPSPPRTAVPPPVYYNSSMPLSTWSEDSMPEYLRQYGWTLKQDMETRGDKMFSWTYHDRQQAQMITPFVYLGTISTMKDEEFLRSTGITMVVALRQPNRFEQTIMARAANVAYGLGIQVAEFAVATVQNLRSILPQTVSVMEQHLSASIQQTGQPGKIFVACQTGNERSATVVCAFLMGILKLSIVDAIQVVQARRFSANIDDDLKLILDSYGDVLDAQRMVVAAPRHAMSGGDHNVALLSSPSKRGRDIEIDSVMEDDDDVARFQGRTTFIPFADT